VRNFVDENGNIWHLSVTGGQSPTSAEKPKDSSLTEVDSEYLRNLFKEIEFLKSELNRIIDQKNREIELLKERAVHWENKWKEIQGQDGKFPHLKLAKALHEIERLKKEIKQLKCEHEYHVPDYSSVPRCVKCDKIEEVR